MQILKVLHLLHGVLELLAGLLLEGLGIRGALDNDLLHIFKIVRYLLYLFDELRYLIVLLLTDLYYFLADLDL